MPTISEALAIAVQHHQAGRLQAAEEICRQILGVDPNNADSMHLLGVIASQKGILAVAAEYISRAIALVGTEAVFHSNLGAVFKDQGKLDEAVACCRRALELKPDYATAHYNLGIVLQAQEKLDEAATCFRRAIELKPDYALAHNNLGNVLLAQGKLDEAIACFSATLEWQPDFAVAHFNLGTAFQAQGKLEQAVASFQQALNLQPNFADAHFSLGNAFQAQGKPDEAIESYRRTLELKPDYAEAHTNLGTVFDSQRKSQQAVAAYRRAIELRPDYALAHYNLGTLLRAEGKLDEAAGCFHRAFELKPDYAEALNNLSVTLQAQGKLDEAIKCCLRALELKPDLPEAHASLGNAFQEQRRLEEAIASYRRALELKPDFTKARNNLGNAFKAQGKMDEAIESYRLALDLAPDSSDAHNNLGNVYKDQGKLTEALEHFRQAIRLQPHNVGAQSNLLYTLYFCPEYDAARIYEEHCLWNHQYAEPLLEFIKPHLNNANPDRRLRIGYISPNFRLHAQSFFLVPLLASHNHQQFEIFCYSDVVEPDDITAKLRSYSDTWRTTKWLSDVEVARLVRGDQIDILVDLTMHIANGRPLLFARKPAPVQVCWLAYQGTTGLSTIDYRLTDPQLDPPGLFDAYYSEESVRLPDSFWCYDPLTTEPALNLLPASEKGSFTFGSLNNFCKVNDDVLRLWARVLRAVDRSKLILLAGEGSHLLRTREFLEKEGIAPERITFTGYRPRPDYLKLYHEIDIGLDTFPYNGQTTTLDAIWMGVPVVTIIGQTSAARAGASLLRNLGTPELIADSPDQFVSIAVELANNLSRLGELRTSLRQRLEKSPLMDAPRFAANVEAAYRNMWQRWCAARRDSSST